MKRRFLILLLWTVSGSALLFSQTAWSQTSTALTIQPADLKIGTFFSGSTVTISGDVPGGQDVIIKIIGKTKNQKFDIKGRIGPFWMTRDKTELEGAPAMYAVLLPAGEGWTEQAATLGLGLEDLQGKISVDSGSQVPDDLFDMFLKLKKSEGLYEVLENAVTYTSGEGGHRHFTAAYRFPRSTAVGQYTIRAVAVSDGRRAMEQSTGFSVTEVGFARIVDDLATNRRLTYGILAVVIALFTGAIMGVLFKGGGSH